MNHEQTKIVRIEIDGRIRRQITLSQPATLAEIWNLPQILELGPHRMARLGADGVAYVSVNSASYEAWLLAAKLADDLPVYEKW